MPGVFRDHRMKGLKWVGIFGGVILLLVLASLGFRAVQERGIAGKLAKLRDRGHPTTMAELNAWYVAVPAESNAALGVLAAMEMFPSVVPDKLPLVGLGAARVERFDAWSDEARSLARKHVASNSTAYAALVQALRLPASRYPDTISFSASIIHHLTQVKASTQNLTLAAHLAAEEGKSEEATAAVVNAFLVARTLEPEPLLISALIRNFCVGMAVSSSERIVNRVELTDDQLARVQAQVASVLSTNVFARMLAGETAFGLDNFAAGSARMGAMANLSGAGTLGSAAGSSFGYTLYTWSGLKGADHECYLDAMIRLQEAANEEFPQRLTTVSNIAYEVIGDTNGFPFVKAMSRMVIPSLAKGSSREARLIATLRCALAALAVERFRIAHGGTLPVGLADLVPQYFAAVPSDPYDGKPLRFKPLKKGFVVYSLGEDGDDDGGRPRKIGGESTTDYDVTFRIER